MIARLGIVCFWLGVIAAGVTVAFGATLAVVMRQSTNQADVSGAPWVFCGFVMAALICWLTGRGFRYLFSGYF